ncbi:MAG: adenosylcobinamide-GDP ribazoletransferase [Coriobacteriia bacterium]|nr:adenosylcobinamide-GDP ribazoletransferase [Coriobacteriia bacterium]
MFRDAKQALAWLTVLPLGTTVEEGDPVPWFPWVGVLVGASSAGAAWCVRSVAHGEAGAFLASTSAVAVSAAVTGMLHLDGLADTADALIGSRSRDERLRILRDSRIGSYAAASLFLALAFAIIGGAAAVTAGRYAAFVWAAVAARWGAALALSLLPAARTDGMAAAIARGRGVLSYCIAAAPLLAVAPWALSTSIPAVVTGLVASVAAPWSLSRRLGGVTGDILGAGIVLTEAATLVAAALTPR